MNNFDFKKVYEFCKLLENDGIRKEIEEQIEGYSLEGIYKDVESMWYVFMGADDKKILLTFFRNRIALSKQSNNMVEGIYADESLLLSHKIIEKRPNGVIYSNIYKNFNSNKDAVLRYLIESRYAFTKDNLESYFTNFDFEKMDMRLQLTRLNMTQYGVGLDRISDFHSELLISSVSSKNEKDYPTAIYLNGKNISSVFDAVDGPDRVYRIYDLYRGVINSRNEKDTDLIRSGLLSQDAYDLKGLRGITEKEDSIVGKSLDGVSLDRDSVLASIARQKLDDNLTKNKPKRLLRRLFGRK